MTFVTTAPMKKKLHLSQKAASSLMSLAKQDQQALMAIF